MWLYEDDARNHIKATCIDTDKAGEKNIQHCFTPANSPDFNMSEAAWCYIKDMIPGHNLQREGTSQYAVELAQIALYYEWNRLPQELIDRWCHNFHRNLSLSLERNGKNNYNA